MFGVEWCKGKLIKSPQDMRYNLVFFLAVGGGGGYNFSVDLAPLKLFSLPQNITITRTMKYVEQRPMLISYCLMLMFAEEIPFFSRY